MENALNVKVWAIDTVGDKGWTLIAMRAFPEILLCDRKISLLNIGKFSEFDREHIEILNRYFIEVYGIEIPESISGYKPKIKGSVGFSVDWVDKITGKIKVSITIIKPGKWFDELFK